MTTPWQGGHVNVDIDGDEAQIVAGTLVNGDLIQVMKKFVRGQPAMYLGSVEISDRVACYVPARNHDDVVKALQTTHAAVLIGPLGCGRETAAIASMRQLCPGIPIRRFSLEDEDVEELDDKGRCGYLIRAADGGLARLGRCVDAVRASSGYLVIVGGHGTEHDPAVANLPCLPIEAPHALEVYRRRLQVRQMLDWQHWDEAPALLASALPAEARRLADLVGVADSKEGNLATRQAEVTDAYRGWKDDLRRWFTEHQEPRDRLLLIAAATLSSSTPVEFLHVYRAAYSLGQRMSVSSDGGGLDWCPVTGLRALLTAMEEEEQIIFRRHGFATSALRHTLADYPLARLDLLAWLAALPTEGEVSHGKQNSLTETFADMAAEHDAPGLITDSASTWAKAGLADLAFIALSRTCLHPQVGKQVRRALYDWSTKASTDQTLKLTIARVCEPLGQTYPGIALTRLKHLATHGNNQVREQVLFAALALNSFGHHTVVLTSALDWCAEINRENLPLRARRRRRQAGATLFLRLATPVAASGVPELLTGDQAVDAADCVPGWRAALELYASTSSAAVQTIATVLWQWLDAARLQAVLRTSITWVFVEAAAPADHPPRVSQNARQTEAQLVIDLVRRWAAADPTNPVRREIKEAIVIPLTQPRWVRLLKRLHVGLRARLASLLND